MSNFREYNQSQGIFRVIVPGDLLDEIHPARVIDRVVEKLDLSRVYADYFDEGNPPYHPKMMLKVLFYSYHCGLMSCRKIWGGLKGRADYIFLSGDQVPDFRTINAFRTRHIKELPDLFAQIVMLCESLDMIGFEHLAIDGQKIQADASYRKSLNRERLETRYNKVKKGMEKLVNTEPGTELPEETRRKRIEKLEKEETKLEVLAEKLSALEKEGIQANINLTDEDALMMKHKNGRSLPSYNHQSAIDGKLGITVSVDTKVVNDTGDDLLPLVDAAVNNAGGEFKNVLADSAFGDYETFRNMEENRTEEFYVPDRLHESSKKDDGGKGGYAAGRFEKTPSGGLICPENEPMRVKSVTQKEDHHVTVHEGTACGNCKVREKCTRGEKRTVSIDSREPYRDRMREKLNTPQGREIYSMRQWLVEAPHGHDQKNMGWTQHHLRGHAKAGIEFILMRIGANLGKIVRYRPFEALAFCESG